MFTLTIETDNAAFGDDDSAGLRREVARILFEVRRDITNHHTGGKLRDINGNTVGRWELTR